MAGPFLAAVPARSVRPSAEKPGGKNRGKSLEFTGHVTQSSIAVKSHFNRLLFIGFAVARQIATF